LPDKELDERAMSLVAQRYCPKMIFFMNFGRGLAVEELGLIA